MHALPFILTLALALPLVGCGESESGDRLSREEVSAALQNALGAALPASAVNVRGRKVSLMTTCLDLTFACPAEDMNQWARRTRIPSFRRPKAEEDPFDEQHDGPEWFRTEALKDVLGLTARWNQGPDAIHLSLAMGTPADESQRQILVRLVFEANPDRPVTKMRVHYGGSPAGPGRLGKETITDPETIRLFLAGIDRPEDCDIGPTKCIFGIRVELLASERSVLTADVGTDGCQTVRVLKGDCPAAGKSGYLLARDGYAKSLMERLAALCGQGETPTGANDTTATQSN